MKKFLLAVSALFILTSIAFAQAKKPVKKEAPPVTKTAEAKKAEPAVKAKADGTPDMRYKENKESKATPAKGPLKKDGTPDKRFKENKDVKPEPANGPLKKDGTPDKRYKENKEEPKKKGKG